MNDDPNIFEILLGIHGYGMDPELETAWCRLCLLGGLLLGLMMGLGLCGR